MPLSMPTNRSHLDFAGITTPTGKLDRPLAAGTYLAPGECWVEEGYVAWSNAEQEPYLCSPNGSLLDDFLNARRDDFALRDFVGVWGPLQMEEATRRWLRPSYPEIGSDQVRNFLFGMFGQGVPGVTEYEAADREPAFYYTGLSEHFQALLNLAADIYTQAHTKSEWLKKYPFIDEYNPCGIEGARDEVELGVKRLLDLGEVSFSLDWKKDQWQIEIYFSGIIGALASKLMLAIARADGLYTCSGCGNAYIRSAQTRDDTPGGERTRRRRAPKPGESNYCSTCGDSRARMNAKRRYREKICKAIDLSKKGMSVERIAETLDTDSFRVLGWIQKATKDYRT
jgi:hypothetical protein